MYSTTLASLIRKSDSCWIWLGVKSNSGYGILKGEGAHRAVFREYKGPIPEGMHIDHLCHVRPCVNPDHLRMVTPAEKCLRNNTNPYAVNAAKTHCKYGHEFTSENTYVSWQRKAYRRTCRTCFNKLANNWYHKNKALISERRKAKRAAKKAGAGV